MPEPAAAPWYHRVWWRLSAAAGHVVDREWIIAVVFSIGLASLGASFGVVPDLAAEGWGGNPRLVWLEGFLAGAVVFLGAGVLLWWRRNTVLAQRGTAYIISEYSAHWAPEQKDAFLAAVRSQFAHTVQVPGPADLGADWHWPLTHRTGEWDQRVDELVRAYWATHHNDDKGTPNALYVWAPWPVARAFGARAVAGRRGLVLHVRQRPSFGRAGHLLPGGFRQGGHTFTDHVADPSGDTTGTSHEHPVTLTIGASVPAANSARPITVLLLRTSTQPYGPLHVVPATSRLRLDLVDGAGLDLAPEASVTVREWRHLPASGTRIDWASFPTLVAQAAEWICRESAADPQATILLGAAIPQEFAVGLGIHAASRDDWPTAMWPLLWHTKDQPLVVPRVNLGTGRRA